MAALMVKPSGDRTGVTDRRNLERQVLAATTHGVGYEPAATVSVVSPDGLYYLDRPLVVGDPACSMDSLVNPPCILSEGLAVFTPGSAWNGDNYLLRYFGVSRASALAVTRMRNLRFDCDDRCRGLLVVGCHQFPSFENLHVRRSLRVGLDALACYTSRWAGIHIDRGNGYAARFAVFNSASLRDIRIANMQCSEWPADEDAVAIYEDGSLWNIPATHDKLAHCLMYLDGNASDVDNLSFEGNQAGHLPLLRMAASSADVATVRCEANTATRCKVQIVGAAYTNRGHHNRLRNLYVRDSGACTQLVEQSGQTSHNVIDEINSGAITVPVH